MKDRAFLRKRTHKPGSGIHQIRFATMTPVDIQSICYFLYSKITYFILGHISWRGIVGISSNRHKKSYLPSYATENLATVVSESHRFNVWTLTVSRYRSFSKLLALWTRKFIQAAQNLAQLFLSEVRKLTSFFINACSLLKLMFNVSNKFSL